MKFSSIGIDICQVHDVVENSQWSSLGANTLWSSDKLISGRVMRVSVCPIFLSIIKINNFWLLFPIRSNFKWFMCGGWEYYEFVLLGNIRFNKVLMMFYPSYFIFLKVENFFIHVIQLGRSSETISRRLISYLYKAT